jgi:O-antigen ligase
LTAFAWRKSNRDGLQPQRSRVLIATNTDAALDRPSRRSASDSLVFYGVFGLLLFGPLAFGAADPWSIFVLEVGAALLFAVWVVRQAAAGELWITGSPLFPPMLVFAALVIFQLATGQTAYRYETLRGTMLYVAYGLLCFLVVQCLRRRAQVKTLALTFSVYGFALAMFALIQSMSFNGKVYWVSRPRFGGWVYGPYVNHNHYAGLMEMLAPIPLVFSLTRFARGPRRTVAVVAGAMMASTIFLSGSRGGMAAFAVQMAVLAAVLIRRHRGRKTALALGVFLVVVVGVLAWLGGGELSKRMATFHTEARRELSGGMRMAVNRDGLKMFGRKPLLGWGLGVFPDIYPQFRSFSTNFFVNEAHNDYLQLLIEMGALGFTAMLWFVLAMYRGAITKLGNWPEDTNGAAALAAMLGSTGILVHSFVDFNLQIPANAALFYVLCVVAAMEPRFGLSRRKPVRRSEAVPAISE